MTAFVVFNPNAAGGKTGRDWREIEAALERVYPLLSFFVTTAPGQAAQMVRDALRDGHMEIVAVGGDGTINEALNGFFHKGVAVSPDAVLSFVHNGRETRLCRRFGIAPGWRAGIAHLDLARVKKHDLGRVACVSAGGAPLTRYFLDAASFGRSAAVVRALGAARIARLFGLGFARRLHGLAAWRGACRVRLMGQGHDEIAGIADVRLTPSDGAFDITVTAGPAAARIWRGARLAAAPTLETKAAVAVETDGESAGVLPAGFELCPAAINIRV